MVKQKKWKIVAIYRNNGLILPKYSTTILPNDALLLVGEPDTLWEIYHRIQEESGQFPTPFGRDVVLYFDLACRDDFEEYIKEIKDGYHSWWNRIINDIPIMFTRPFKGMEYTIKPKFHFNEDRQLMITNGELVEIKMCAS